VAAEHGLAAVAGHEQQVYEAIQQGLCSRLDDNEEDSREDQGSRFEQLVMTDKSGLA